MMEDMMIKSLICNGNAWAYTTSTQQLVEEARKLHGLSPVCTVALGRTLTAAAMMGDMLKGEESSVTISIDGGGPCGKIVAVGKKGLGVKGYVHDPLVDLPLVDGKLDVAGAVGKNGSLTVIRDLGMKEPYVGRVRLQTGKIASDLAFYYALSEQTPSMVYLSVQLDRHGHVKSACGAIIQPLPGCPEEELQKMEASAGRMDNFSAMIEGGATVVQASETLFTDMNMQVMEKSEPKYGCGCSREKIERVLLSLGEEELHDMAHHDKGAHVACQFCMKEYGFNEQELEELLEKGKEVESEN